MKALKIIAAIGLASFLGCAGPGASNPEAGAPPKIPPGTLVRGVVEASETVWMGLAKACIATGDEAILKQCDAVLSPTRDIIVEAGAVVDTWTDVDRGMLPCMLMDIKTAFVEMNKILTHAGLFQGQIYNDTMVLFSLVNTTCGGSTSDAGGQ